MNEMKGNEPYIVFRLLQCTVTFHHELHTYLGEG